LKHLTAIVQTLNFDGSSWEDNFVFGESFLGEFTMSGSWAEGYSFSVKEYTNPYRSCSWSLGYETDGKIFTK